MPAPGVEFVGTASDPEDGDLTGIISWTDNGSPLGTGPAVFADYSCLEAGSHVILATIMDSGGLSATATITIHVNNNPPTVTIDSPSSSTPPFGPCPVEVSFTGTAGDFEDGDLTADISWFDKGAGFGFGGNASKIFSCTQTGFRKIDANVVDSGGASGSDSITIEITGGGVCKPKRASCIMASECCSNKCKGKLGARTCK